MLPKCSAFRATGFPRDDAFYGVGGAQERQRGLDRSELT